MYNTLDKFTKGWDKLNIVLGNQRTTYDINGVCYERNNNATGFSKMIIGHLNVVCLYVTTMVKVVMCFLLCFIKKNYESKKNAYSISHFYKENHGNKMRNIFVSSYFYNHNYSWKSIDNMHSINWRGPKKIWITKVKILNCLADMLNKSNSKYYINSDCWNHMTKDINILSYFTSTKGGFYGNNKDNSIRYEIVRTLIQPWVILIIESL